MDPAPEARQEGPPPAAGRKSGIPLVAVLVVLAVLVIAAVAAQIRHQRHGATWNSSGSTVNQAFPRCVSPYDTLSVVGVVTASRADAPDRPCYAWRFPTPTSLGAAASAVANDAAKVALVCGARAWYHGTGTYVCHRGGRGDKFYWADWAENTDRENFGDPCAGIWGVREGYDQRRRRRYSEGFGGSEGFQAYGPHSPFEGIGIVGARHGPVANPLSPYRAYDPAYDVAPRSVGPPSEPFIGGGEPLCYGPGPGPDTGRENFSPDMPGSCPEPLYPLRGTRAARAEGDALRVLAGA